VYSSVLVRLGLVRLRNWCAPRKGWEQNAYRCPPNSVALVMSSGKRGRGILDAELERFLARQLRLADNGRRGL
jgi:hypothetical protein